MRAKTLAIAAVRITPTRFASVLRRADARAAHAMRRAAPRPLALSWRSHARSVQQASGRIVERVVRIERAVRVERTMRFGVTRWCVRALAHSHAHLALHAHAAPISSASSTHIHPRDCAAIASREGNVIALRESRVYRTRAQASSPSPSQVQARVAPAPDPRDASRTQHAAPPRAALSLMRRADAHTQAQAHAPRDVPARIDAAARRVWRASGVRPVSNESAAPAASHAHDARDARDPRDGGIELIWPASRGERMPTPGASLSRESGGASRVVPNALHANANAHHASHARDMSAHPAPMPMPMPMPIQNATSIPASMPAFDSAALDRLSDDVMRRIERKMRIERQRRGL